MKQSQRSQSIWSEVEPYCILHRIRKNFWMILMSAGLFALCAYIWSVLLIHPTYTCSATFVVTPRNSSSITQGTSSITASTTDQFAKLLSGPTLVNRVQRLSGKDVEGAKVSSSVINGTNLIQLRVSAPSPRAAYYMCSGILEHYEDYAQFVFNSVMLETVSAPVIPDKGSFWLTLRRTEMIAVILGALAMVVLLAVLSITSGTVQTVEGARNQIDGNLLVALNHQRKRRTLKSMLRRRKTSLLISNPTTAFLYVESIHQLRARVEHAGRQHGCKTFLVTSVSENEGKSTVAANLALSLAKRHKKVLLMDCDLRKCAQHLIFEVAEKNVTLNALLKGELAPEQLVQALHYSKSDNLFFLFASNVQRHSAELLGSNQMRRLVEILRDHFDYIILDSSPLGFFTDSEILSDLADASLIVVRQDMMPDKAINDGIDSLSRCKSRFLGYVFNDVHTLNLAAGLVAGHSYGYGYGHIYGYGYGKNRKKYGYGYYGGSEKSHPDREDVKLNTSRKKEN